MVRVAVLAALTLAACDVGEIPEAGGGDGGNGGGDGGGSGSACEPIAAQPPDGHHNEGQACRQSGCHGTGASPQPEFSIAGTVYKDAAGTMPYPGATVFVTVGGVTKKTIAATNGNFWMVPALMPTPTTAMTGTTSATACPNKLAMNGALVNGGGDCNNCHKTGGTASPIYVTP